MPFYDDMAAMVRDLLAPDARGGLGQGPITIKRTTPGAPDADAPWVPVNPVVSSEVVNQISTAKAEYTQNGTVITTDLAYMTEPSQTLDPKPGDTVERGGVHVGVIVHVEPFPAHGVRVYQKLFVNI